LAKTKYGEWGKFYWCVKSKGGETFLHADKAHVTESGALLFTGKQRVTVAFSSGNWDYYYAASVLDDSPVSVERGLGYPAN